MDRQIIERTIIASLIVDPTKYEHVIKIVKESDFHDKAMRFCFVWIGERITAIDDAQKAVDMILLISELSKEMDSDYGDLIVNMVRMLPTPENATAYCGELLNINAHERAQDIVNEIMPSMSADDIKLKLAEISEEIISTPSRLIIPPSEAADMFKREIDVRANNPGYGYVATGIEKLDRALGGGFYNDQFYVIGARPSMGKTSFVLNIANEMVSKGNKVLFVSLEMTRFQLNAKRVASVCGIKQESVMRGEFVGSGVQDLYEIAIDKISKMPLFITDKSGLTISDIRTLILQLPDVKAVIIDYLGLISPSDDDVKKPRYEQITAISNKLKMLSKDMHLPIIVLAQLNREVAKQADKRPHMHDLRDSGSIEQDADNIILLHRPAYYEEKQECVEQQLEEELDLIIEKARYGEPQTVVLTWDKRHHHIKPDFKPVFRPVQETFGGDMPF